MAGSLGRMMQAFKSTATHEYVTGVRQHLWPPFCARLWQRNYYEHVIQNERELDKIREYIATNPLKWALDRENPQRTERSVEEDTLFDINRPQVSRRGNQNQRPQSPAVG